VQDGSLLFAVEAELRHRLGGGKRVVERVIAAEDHPVDGAPGPLRLGYVSW
jgi:hypothetical protein